MPTIPTTLGDLSAPTPSRAAPGYNVPSGPNLAPLEASGNAVSRSVQGMGDAAASLGQALSGTVNTVVDQQNRDAMIDAADRENQYQAKVRNYLYAPDTGILNLKGKDAIGASKRAEDFLNTARDETLDGVTNPFAQQALTRSIGSASNSAMETAQRFEQGQKTAFQGQVLDNTMGNAQNAIAAQPYDDKLFATNLNTALSAAEQKTRMTLGQSATLEDMLDSHRKAASSLWATRIQTALTSNDPSAIAQAGQWYAQAKAADQLDFQDDDKLGHTLKAVVPNAESALEFQKIGQTIHIDGITAPMLYSAGQAGDPGELSQSALLNGLIKQESAGNPNAVGPAVPGQGTAKGLMQVMDATAFHPGYGITPAKDNSPEERVRVGTEYLAAMQGKYGDNQLALAAYNAGPGTVDAAIEKAGTKDPAAVLALLPSQTQAYVPKVIGNASQYQAQNGIGYDPSIVQAAAAKLPADQRQYFIARADADHQAIVQGYQTAQRQAIDATQTALANTNGNIASIPANVRAQAIQYGVWPILSQTLGKSDGAMVNSLKGMNTDQLIATDFNDPNIRMRLSAGDLQEWQKKQSDMVTNPANQTISRNIDGGLRYAFQTDSIINPATTKPVTGDQMEALRGRLESGKTLTTDEDGNITDQNGNAVNPDKDTAQLYDKFMRVKNIVSSRVIADYQAGNKQAATPDNIRNVIDSVLIDEANGKERQIPVAGTHAVPGTGWLGTNFHADQAQNAKGISDIRVEDIPSDTRINIQNFLQSRNMPINEANVLDAYTRTLAHARKVGPYLASQAKAAPQSDTGMEIFE